MKRTLAVTLILIAGIGLSGCSAGSSPISGASDTSTKEPENFRVIAEYEDPNSLSEIRLIEILTPEGTWLRCTEEKVAGYYSGGASIDCDWAASAEPR